MMDRNATGKEVMGGPPRRLRMAVTTGGVFGVEWGGREGVMDARSGAIRSVAGGDKRCRGGGVFCRSSPGGGGAGREGVTDAWSGALQAATSDTEGDVLSLSSAPPPLRCRFMFF
ncbi:hypothetical protein C4D60_Mb08t01530 [Musa balbisiana]|uniref:Uncharacterized protein n=1 Tax=Musa balbisiana TaxID=52838 RepID=A0A4S8K0N5_MUSBA|nr:hypothetical protein C4D60_Mb08t01530 [Musa balbisiana]